MSYRYAREARSTAKAGVGEWIAFYNRKCPHSALGGKSPAVVYSGGKVWAPDNDKTYSGKLLNGDVLTMSGCVPGCAICRGSDFTHIK
nr:MULTISPECIES: DUF2147 domain-containing protein [unclassified Ruegeria]